MYMSTCIRNKNCHQHSYGFENFMSSWGSCSKSPLSNHNVPLGSSENPYGEARSAEFDGTGWTVIKSVLQFSSYFVGI